jgi:hypothetical protein
MPYQWCVEREHDTQWKQLRTREVDERLVLETSMKHYILFLELAHTTGILNRSRWYTVILVNRVNDAKDDQMYHQM